MNKPSQRIAAFTRDDWHTLKQRKRAACSFWGRQQYDTGEVNELRTRARLFGFWLLSKMHTVQEQSRRVCTDGKLQKRKIYI